MTVVGPKHWTKKRKKKSAFELLRQTNKYRRRTLAIVKVGPKNWTTSKSV